MKTKKMKPQTILYLFVALFFFAYSCNGNKQEKETKVTEPATEVLNPTTGSFKIEYNTLTQVEGMEMKGRVLQWIDLKNKRFRMEMENEMGLTSNKQVMKSLLIGNDEWTWVIDLSSNTGLKFNSASYDDNPLQKIKNEDETDFEEAIKNENGKIVGTETVLGKKCTIVSLPLKHGENRSTMKAWYYHGIPLKIVAPFYTMEATSFEENVEIPEENLKVPDNITFMEMPDM